MFNLYNKILKQQYIIHEEFLHTALISMYKGMDKNNNSPVLINIVNKKTNSLRIEDVIRFKNRMKDTLGFEHPHILRLIDIGEEDNLLYFINEYIECKSLKHVSKEKEEFNIQQITKIVYHIALGLEYAHQRNTYHLNLNPENIAIDNNENVKIFNFGLSDLLDYSAIDDQKKLVEILYYTSPEQAGILKTLPDGRSDLYSLGIILYQLLTKRLPFEGKTSEELLHQHISLKPISPRKINPQVSEALEEVVLKLLNKDPQERYQSSKGLIKDLERIRSGDTSFIVGREDFLGKLSYRTRLVGREEELDRLKESFQKSLEGQGNIIFVTGEAGRGKSRLIDEFAFSLLERGVIFASGKCYSQRNKIPYQVLRDVLNNYIEEVEKLELSKKEEQIQRLKEVLGELGEIIVKINPNIKILIGEQPSLIQLDPEREQRRFLMVASNFFLNLSTKVKPVVLYLDDLQWADEGTLSILEEINIQIKNFPLSIVGSYRSNEVTESHTITKIKKRAEEEYELDEIKLKPFDHVFVNKLISQLMLAEEEKMYELSGYILEKSQGNAFFSIEILRQFVEQKGLVYQAEEKRWYIDWETIRTITIPTNIVDIVLRRIEGLEEEHANLLSYCSCIGTEFEFNLLFKLIELSKEKIISHIDKAIRLQLIEKSEERGRLLFVHDRIRDAFYIRLNSEEKKKVHLKIAQSLEAVHEDDLEAFLFELAHHYVEAEDKDKSLQYALPAAQKAKINYANEEAVKYYTIAIKLLEEKGQKGGAEWIKAKAGLGEICLVVGRYDEGIQIFRQVLPYKEEIIEKAKIYRDISTAYFKKGDLVNCEKEASKSLALLGEKVPRTKLQVIFSLINQIIVHVLHNLFPGIFFYKDGKTIDPRYSEIVWSYHRLGWMYIVSDVVKFVRVTLKMLNLSEAKIGKSKQLGFILSCYAVLCSAIPLVKRSVKYHQMGLNLRQEVEDEWGVAQALQFMGASYLWQGKYNKSIEYAMEGLERFQKIGDMWETAMCADHLSFNYCYLGDYEKALEFSMECLKISQKINDIYGISSAAEGLSRIYICKGDYEKALEWGKKGLELSEKEKIWFITCVIKKYLGEIKIEDKKYDEAIGYFLEAEELDRQHNFLRDYVVSLYSYLAEAYIGQITENREQMTDKEKKEIKKACQKALKQTKYWVNYYGSALTVYAKYLSLIGKDKKSEKYFLKAVKHTNNLGRKYELGKALYEYGNFLKGLNRENQAKKKWQEAYNIFKGIGAKVYIERVEKIMGMVPEEETSQQERFSQERRLKTLITVSHFLSSILDLDELLEKIVDSSIKISGAERGFLLLYSSQKRLEVKVAKGLEEDVEIVPEMNYKKYKLSAKIIKKAEEKEESLLVNSTTNSQILKDEEIRAYRIKSIIITPLKIRDEVSGYLYLDNRMVEEAFSKDDLDLVNSLGIQATISLQNAFLVKEMVEKERLKEEMQLGREIQMNLIPKTSPEVEGLKVSGFMEPAKEIGGDYYDFIKVTKSPDHQVTRAPEVKNLETGDWKLETSDQLVTGALETGALSKLGIVIGDVSGKGVGAGLLMAMVKTAIHILSQEETSPKQILLRINQILYQHVGGEKFITMLYFQWESDKKILKYSSAGHEHILVYREQKTSESKTDSLSTYQPINLSFPSAKVEVIKSGGFMLGMIPEIGDMLEDCEISVNSGDKIVLYTDGVTEARNKEEKQFSLEGLIELVNKYGDREVEELISSIKKEVYKFIGNREQYDDITLVGIQVK